jgi:hypothetical protein
MLIERDFISFADLLVKLQIKGKSVSIKDLTSEIMLILDKNSLRFNKYQFKNYINTRIEKRLNNIENDIKTKLNKVG